MRICIALLALPLMAQLSTITDSLKSPVDNLDFTGTLDIEAAPACKMTRGGVSYGQMKRRYCIGVTGSACQVTSAAGVVNLQLVPNDAGTTPTGCFYTARYTPTSGTAYSETWFVTAATPVKIKDVRTNLAPTPSALIKAAQIDTSGLPSGCIYGVGGNVASTGLPCPSANPTSMYSATFTTACASVPVGTHGFTAGGLVARATDNSTGEVLTPSVDTHITTTRTVDACFATAPASWTLNIFGAAGSGLPSFPLISGDVTYTALQTGNNSLQQMWTCYDSTGVEFDCLATVNPSTFAVRIQHSPFVAGSYAVPIGR